MKKKQFKVKPEHIKLLQRMRVGWQDCETGAPEIDPKRPYGNSSVANDIHEILTGESVGCTNSKRDELSEEERDTYMTLHHQTDTALQIFLYNLGIKPGVYEAEEDSDEWHKVKEGK